MEIWRGFLSDQRVSELSIWMKTTSKTSIGYLVIDIGSTLINTDEHEG